MASSASLWAITDSVIWALAMVAEWVLRALWLSVSNFAACEAALFWAVCDDVSLLFAVVTSLDSLDFSATCSFDSTRILTMSGSLAEIAFREGLRCCRSAVAISASQCAFDRC